MAKQKSLTDAAAEVRELTGADMKRAKPFSELPESLQKKLRTAGVRGPQKSPTKERITIRLSRDVLSYFRSGGPGWQGKVDDVLRAAVRRKTT